MYLRRVIVAGDPLVLGMPKDYTHASETIGSSTLLSIKDEFFFQVMKKLEEYKRDGKIFSFRVEKKASDPEKVRNYLKELKNA